MNESNSLIKYSKETLRTAALRVSSEIKEDRLKLWEANIDRVIKGGLRKRDGGWFTYRRYTRQEAEQHLKNDCSFLSTHYEIFHIRNGRRLEVCQRVLKACEHAEEIFLSMDDAESLGLA